jgi:hypothetical protein
MFPLHLDIAPPINSCPVSVNRVTLGVRCTTQAVPLLDINKLYDDTKEVSFVIKFCVSEVRVYDKPCLLIYSR